MLAANAPISIRISRIIEHPGRLASAAWSADSRTIGSATMADFGPGYMSVWDAISGRRIALATFGRTNVVRAELPIGMISALRAMVVPGRLDWPNGPTAARLWRFPTNTTSLPDHAPLQWRISPFEAAASFDWPDDVGSEERLSYRRIEISPDEQLVAVAANSNRAGVLALYRSSDRQAIARLGLDRPHVINDIRFSRTGELIAVVGSDLATPEEPHHVYIVDRALRVQATFSPAEPPATVSAAFSGDSSYLVTGTSVGWSRRSARVSRLTREQLRTIDPLRLDGHGATAALTVRNRATGEPVATLDAPDAGVVSIDWSADNRLIAAVLFDHSLIVWAWPSRAVVLRVRPASPSAAESLCARFSPDARMLALCVGGSLVLLNLGESI
jgi:WD40 repeat protein